MFAHLSKIIYGMKIQSLIVAGLLFSIFSCSGPQEDHSLDLTLDSTKSTNETKEINDDLYFQEIDPDSIQPLPSPLQIVMRFKQTGMKYDHRLPYKPENLANADRYFDRLILNGFLSADFVYLVANKQTGECPKYIKALRDNSAAIGFGDIVNTEYNIKRIESNLNNIDSIAYIASEIQMNTDRYFRENNDYLRGLIVFSGAWIETLYLVINSPDLNDNFDAVRAISDQLDVANHILENFQLFKIDSSKEISQLKQHIQSIKLRLEILHDYTEKEDLVMWKKELDNLKNTVESIRNYYIIQ